jgi:hypothetical protein
VRTQAAFAAHRALQMSISLTRALLDQTRGQAGGPREKRESMAMPPFDHSRAPCLPRGSTPIRRLKLSFCGLALGLTATVPAAAMPRTTPIFNFFEGESYAESVLHTLLSPDVRVQVRSTGRLTANTLVLDQIVTEGSKPPRVRQWRISRIAPDRYQGTLSDATSPLTIDVVGERIRLRYRMKGGLAAEQWLSFAADGKSAQNEMTIRKFGFKVASIEETIRKR